MAETSMVAMPPPLRETSRKAAIVGVGETDYRADYQAQRARAPGYEPPTAEGLAITAFERALAETGLARSDIDGLCLSFLYGGPTPEEMAPHLGLAPRYTIAQGGIMAGILPRVCADIAAGKATTVAMVYGVTPRSAGRTFGGNTYKNDNVTPPSYYYYHPWGWSSQAAHWAMTFRHYQQQYGIDEADLGAVAVQLRRNAIAHPNAVMQAPMTIEDYLAARYIVRPLRLFDMCMVNDGAVCLIVTTADRARDLPRPPVLVAGWGEARVKTGKFDALIRQRLRPQLADAIGQTLAMADLDVAAIQHFEGYDPASFHLVNQIEGYGLVPPGEGLARFKSGDLAVGGTLPVNTGGGMMSGSYMHGWNLAVEAVRQLRHEADGRQIAGVETSLMSVAQTDQAHPVLFTRS